MKQLTQPNKLYQDKIKTRKKKFKCKKFERFLSRQKKTAKPRKK